MMQKLNTKGNIRGDDKHMQGGKMIVSQHMVRETDRRKNRQGEKRIGAAQTIQDERLRGR